MKLGKLSKRKEKAGRKVHLPTNMLLPIFGGVLMLTILITALSPQLYRELTRPTFDNAFFVHGYKDRLYNYGTHPTLGEISINRGSYPIVASRAGRRVDETIVIYNDGFRSTLVFGLLSSIACSIAIATLLIRAYTKGKLNAPVALAAGGIVIALIFLNVTNVLLRSNRDIGAYNTAQPLIQGSMALLTFSALQQNAMDLFTQSLDRGAPRDAKDNVGAGYVFHTAEFNRENMLTALTQYPDVQFDEANYAGQTPIQVAVNKQYANIVQILIDEGADPLNPDADGRTLLHIAAENDDVEMLALLLAHTNGLDIIDDNGVTPLALAVRNLDFDTVTLMLDNEADVNALVTDNATFFELMLGTIIRATRDQIEMSPEEQEEYVSLIERMIELEADLYRQDSRGNTALHQATLAHDADFEESGTKNPLLERLTRVLVEAGSSTGTRNVDDRNALSLAHVIRMEYDEWLDQVIEDNIDRLNSYIIDGVSLFQYAVEHGKSETLTKLLNKGMTTKPWIPENEDPLRPLVNRNDLTTARILLEQDYVGPEDTTAGNDGPLHMAARLDHAQMIELLMEFGYDVDSPGNRGNTPLHYAIDEKALISLLTLVEQKADPLIWNNDGITPEMAARELGYKPVTELIRRAIKERDPRRPTPDPPNGAVAPPDTEASAEDDQ